MTILNRFRRNEKGSAIVETATVLPVALIVLAGGFEIARGLSYHHAADKAIRDVARYMARLPATKAQDSALAKALVTELIPAPVSSTVTVSNARFTAGFVSIDCQLTYSFPLLSILPLNTNVTLKLAHEQPFIGE